MSILSALTPSSKPVGSAGFVLTATGSGFIKRSGPLSDPSFAYPDYIEFNGVPYYVDQSTSTGTSCSATIPAAAMAAAGAFSVRVAIEDGTFSNSLTFTVTPALPTITSISPATVNVGDSFRLTVNGTNFVSGATIQIDGADQSTTFVSSTQLQTVSSSIRWLDGGTHSITVSVTGVGVSTGATQTVLRYLPTITSFTPNTKVVGDAAFTLIINGTGFCAGTYGAWNGQRRTTRFDSSTQIEVDILSSDLSSAGGPVIGVINDPVNGSGGGTARNDQAPNIVAFTITNPVPIVTGISPSTTVAGSSALTITVSGDHFVGGTGAAVIKWNGVAQPTTIVSQFECSFVATQTMLAQPGTPSVVAFNGAPGGGTSSTFIFNISGGVPSLDSISPSSVPANSTTTVALIGSSFAPNCTVRVNGIAVVSTWLRANLISLTLTPSIVPTPGDYTVTVTNNGTGGGTSAVRHITATNPVPVLSSLSVSSKTVGDATFTLTLTGSGFVSGSSIGTVGGAARATTYVDATHLQLAVTSADLSTGGTLVIGVTNAAPGGGSSATLTLTVNYPVPTATAFDVSSVVVGSPDTTVTITGTGFGTGTLVKLGATTLTTTYVSSVQVRAVVPAAQLTSTGTLTLTVVNPTPGGGTAVCPALAVVNPVPAITSLAPTNVNAGSAAFSLVIAGAGFRSGVSSAFINGSARTTTFNSSTQLTMAVNASDVTAAGTLIVTVVNSGPGGGTSAPAPLYVGPVNPVATLTSMTPSSRNAGDSAPLVAIVGTNFIKESIVRWEGADRPTTYVDATHVTAQLQDADTAVPGTYLVTVFNPAPGGGLSNALGFVINAVNQAPQITALSPASAAQGGLLFTLTINGLYFMATSSVVLTDANQNTYRPTVTFVNSSQLTVVVPAVALGSVGTVIVAVTNPPPGGGTSSAGLKVQTGNPVPSITNVSPATVVVGASSTTITVHGIGFISTSVVKANGTSLSTTYVNATTLTAVLTSTLASTVSILSITVVNGTPGGGTSNAIAFGVLSPINPTPFIDSLSPDQITRGQAAFLLSIIGGNFIPSSSAAFNGTAKTTAYVSPSRVDASVLAADISLAPGGVARVNPRGHSENVSTNAMALRAFAAGSIESPAITIGPNESKTGFHSLEEGTWQFVSGTIPQMQIGPAGITASQADIGKATIDDLVTRNTVTALLGFFERGRGFGLGDWVNEPFSAAKFSGASDAVWDMSGGAAVIDYSYIMIGETLWLSLDVVGSSISSIPPNELYVLIPNGYVSAKTQFATGFWSSDADVVSGVRTRHIAFIETAGTTIVIRKSDSSTWPTTTTGLNVGFTIPLQVVLTAAIVTTGPSITSVSPASVPIGSAAFTLHVDGHNFADTSTALLTDANAATYTPTVVHITSSRLTLEVPAAAVATMGIVTVAITNPAPIEADDPAAGTATKTISVEPML